MLAHLGHDALCDGLTARDIRLGGHSERVDERLGVRASNVVEKANNELLDRLSRRLDTSNNLRDNLEPDVDVDGGHALRDRLVDTVLVTIREPEGKQTKRVLQRVARRERNRPQEALHSRNNVGRKVGRRQTLLRDLERGDDLEVCKRPRVPRLVPSGVELGRECIVVENR